MADYSQIVDFSAKDALASGNPSKLILGSEMDAELDAISTAIATKYDSNDIASEAQSDALTDNTVLLTPARLKRALENSTNIDRIAVYDSGGTDSLVGTHDGTDLTMTLTNTGLVDWVGIGTSFRIRDGATLVVLDSTDTDTLTLEHNGTNALITTSAGDLILNANSGTVRAADGDTLRAYGSGGANYIDIRHNNTDARVLSNSGRLLIQPGTTSVGLEYAGTEVGATQANGLSAGASTNVTPDATGVGQLQLLGSAYTGYIALDGTGMYLGHNSGARTLVLQTDETDRLTISAAGTIQAGGSIQVVSDSNGFRVGAGGDVDFLFDGTDALIRATSGSETLASFTPNGGVGLFYNNTENLTIQDHTASGVVTGATVRHFDLTAYDVGIATMPRNDVTTGRNITQADFHQHLRMNSASAVALTLTENSAFPTDGVFWVTNINTGAATIEEGTGVTIQWMDGSGTSSTGNRTLAQWGVATVVKITDTLYYIFGTGLS